MAQVTLPPPSAGALWRTFLMWLLGVPVVVAAGIGIIWLALWAAGGDGMMARAESDMLTAVFWLGAIIYFIRRCCGSGCRSCVRDCATDGAGTPCPPRRRRGDWPRWPRRLQRDRAARRARRVRHDSLDAGLAGRRDGRVPDGNLGAPPLCRHCAGMGPSRGTRPLLRRQPDDGAHHP